MVGLSLVYLSSTFDLRLTRTEGEMRRRVWAMLYHLGSVYTAQPHPIAPWFTDTNIVSRSIRNPSTFEFVTT